MKIQFLNGGLANQAFQYIFARYYELSHPGEIMYLDDSYFALNTVHNGYELDKVFGLKPHMLSECFDDEVWNFILEEKKNGKSVPQILCENEIPVCLISEFGDSYKGFNPFEGKVYYAKPNEYSPDILNFPDDVYYHGYWINREWFDKYKEIFLKEFTFPEITDEKNRKYLTDIQNSNSLAIHIRRGDYVTLGFSAKPEQHQIYVDIFTQTFPKNWHLFVFSDDIKWCKENSELMHFNKFKNVTYIEGNVKGKNYIDMQLMSECKAMIVSNSAFCFLAALLNKQNPILFNTNNIRKI